MSQTAEKTGLSVSIGKKEAKHFGFYELLGLRKAFYAIEVSNPKRSGKVDFWLSKNDKIVGDAFAKYLEKEHDLLIQHAEIFYHKELLSNKKEPVMFIVYKGKDDSDTLLNDNGAFFKLSYENNKPILDYVPSPSWDLQVPAAEDGGEPTVQKMKYSIKFVNEENRVEFDKKLAELQNGFSIEADLWQLKEEHLEGVNMVWKGRDEDLTQFRNLIYDNAISL